MGINLNEIQRYPLTTNKIKLTVDKKAFFEKYSILSYYSLDDEYKNLAYEQISDTPCLSVTGIKARWTEMPSSGMKFFILSDREKTHEIKKSLAACDKIRFRIDSLEDYSEKLQSRILSSLAINFLGKARKGRMMYNDGSLILCDDKNFLVPQSKRELVCLKISVNEYLNLTAQTTTFSNPRTWNDVNRHYHCVFQKGKGFEGRIWSGLSLKPVLVKKLNKKEVKLEDLFIKKKASTKRHNLVPYWPFNPEDYYHGRLFAISQVIQSVNEIFNPLLSIDFEDFKVIHFDAYKSGKDTIQFMRDYLTGRSIYIEDPFKTSSSKEFVEDIKEKFHEVMDNVLVFPKRCQTDSMLLKICEPEKENMDQTFYAKSLYRMANSCVAMQHIVYDSNTKDNSLSVAQARRILLELLVKDCLVKRTLPDQMANLMTGWEFTRYKINQGNVIGASITLAEKSTIKIMDMGFGNIADKDFESFSKEHLKFMQPEKIRGARDYMALIKNGNVFLIVDTEEIPILDVDAIDEGYAKVINENVTLSMFKRKAEAHKYLRGYIGFHLWKTDGMNGEKETSYSYISGFNSENLKILPSIKMDKMPRAKRIFVLHANVPDEVYPQVLEICNMLKFGLGRWNELMTYPFPFKFLKEYLDDACETAYCKHWDDITYNKDL